MILGSAYALWRHARGWSASRSDRRCGLGPRDYTQGANFATAGSATSWRGDLTRPVDCERRAVQLRPQLRHRLADACRGLRPGGRAGGRGASAGRGPALPPRPVGRMGGEVPSDSSTSTTAPSSSEASAPPGSNRAREGDRSHGSSRPVRRRAFGPAGEAAGQPRLEPASHESPWPSGRRRHVPEWSSPLRIRRTISQTASTTGSTSTASRCPFSMPAGSASGASSVPARLTA